MQAQEQGAALLAGGRFHEALAVFGQWVHAEPGSLPARVGLARALAGTGDAWGAVAWFNDACRVAPQAVEPAAALAQLLLAQKQFAQALPVYERLVHGLGVRDRVTVMHYGFCLEQSGELDEAVDRYRDALAQDETFLEAHINLAGVLWRLGDFDGSLAHAQRSVALAPEHPYAVRILGTALLQLNRVQEAEPVLRRALQLQPGFVLAEVDMALTLLLAGKLDEGWQFYQSRWRDGRLRRPDFFNPALEWRGPKAQPVAGRRIAVYGEQGFGDVLNFIRYARLLQQDGADVYAVVPAELTSLVESMEGITCYRPGRVLQTDLHVALVDLPMHYGTRLDNIPDQVPYLHAPRDQAAQWRERLRAWDGKLKVGLAWATSPAQVNQRNRDIPLHEFKALMSLPGVQCFSLQKARGQIDPADLPRPDALVDFTGEWGDFADSAAFVEGLDLVISVCTATVHLAGALGKPAWVLLPPNADWRWLLEREDSPWYPTVRLFRRGFDESRTAQVRRATEALRALRPPPVPSGVDQPAAGE